MKPTVAVITPASGNPLIKDCVSSINKQTYPCQHYIFYDGIVSLEQFNKFSKKYNGKNRLCAYWPTRLNYVGENKEQLAARRIYTVSPYLVNEDYICFLNEDDWFKPNHVESLMKVIEEDKLEWAHSLRGVYDKKGNFLFNDDCESLGKYDIWNSPGHHLVESCSYMVRNDILRRLSWVNDFRGYGPDRVMYSILAQLNPNFGCSGEYSMCFRLGGNPGSVNREFFEAGNAEMTKRYSLGFPWSL